MTSSESFVSAMPCIVRLSGGPGNGLAQHFILARKRYVLVRESVLSDDSFMIEMDVPGAQMTETATRRTPVVAPVTLDPKAELARIRSAAGLPEHLDSALATQVASFLWPKRSQACRAA